MVPPQAALAISGPSVGIDGEIIDAVMYIPDIHLLLQCRRSSPTEIIASQSNVKSTDTSLKWAYLLAPPF